MTFTKFGDLKMDFKQRKRIGIQYFVGVAIAVSTIAASALDTDIYLNNAPSVAPNVMFSLDTSGSMVDNFITIPEAYDSAIVYAGSFSRNFGYLSLDGRIPSSPDGLSSTTLNNVQNCDYATPFIDADGFVSIRAAIGFSDSAASDAYAKKVWFPANRVDFSEPTDGSVFVECKDDSGTHGARSGTGGNYASKQTGTLYSGSAVEEISWDNFPYAVIYSGNYLNYKLNPSATETATRAKLQERVFSDAVKRTPEVFAGLAIFEDKLKPGGDWYNNDDIEYFGLIKRAARDNSIRANQEDLLQELSSITYNNATPLGTALVEMLHYFHGKAQFEAGTAGTDPAVLDTNGHYISPVTSACQKNYVLFVTDGSPFNDVLAGQNFTSASGNYPDYNTIIGNTTCVGNCLDEAAKYMSVADVDGDATNNTYDLDGDGTPDPQTVKVYPVGMEIEETLLEETADAAGTENYYATSAIQFENAIIDILANIKATQAVSMVTASSSVDAFSKVSNRNFIYYGMFAPGTNFQWKGNLKKYRVAYHNSGDSNPYNDIAYITDTDASSPEITQDDGQIVSTARSYWSSYADGNNSLKGGVLDRLKNQSSRNMGGINNWNTGNQSIFTTANNFDISNSFVSSEVGAETRTETERAAIVNYARGQDVNDEDGDGDLTEQRGHLGAIVRSGPVAIQYGGTSATPSIVIFAVTTDGVLHAFDDETGDELWSVVMTDAYSRLVEQYDNGGTLAPWWGIDGGITPMVIDNNANGVVETANGDKVYLYINTGLGLKKWIVIDATKATHSSDYAKVMARSEPPMDTSVNPAVPNSGWEEFALSTARMLPLKYRLAGDTTGRVRRAFLYANGLDSIAEFSYGANTTGRGLTIHEADETQLGSYGDVLWKATHASTGYANMTFSFATTPTTVDTNGDGLADLIYAIDVNAQVWRFHVNRAATTTNNLFSGGILAKLGNDSTGNRRRAYKRVDAALVGAGSDSFILLAVGTGDRMNPLSSTDQDRLHIIKDTTAMSGAVPSRVITPSNLYDATNNLYGEGSADEQTTAADQMQSADGWYVDLPGDQKAISAPLISSGIVNFPVYAPANSVVHGCDSGGMGDGYLYRMKVLTAEPASDYDGDSTLSKGDRFVKLNSGGIPGDAVSHTSPTGVKSLGVNRQFFTSDPSELDPNITANSGADFQGDAAGYWFE